MRKLFLDLEWYLFVVNLEDVPLFVVFPYFSRVRAKADLFAPLFSANIAGYSAGFRFQGLSVAI